MGDLWYLSFFRYSFCLPLLLFPQVSLRAESEPCVRTVEEPTRTTRLVRQFPAQGGIADYSIQLANGLIAIPLEPAKNTGSLIIVRQDPQTNEVLFHEEVGLRQQLVHTPVEIGEDRIAALSSNGTLILRSISSSRNRTPAAVQANPSRSVKLAPQFLNSPLLFPSGEILAAAADGSVRILTKEGRPAIEGILQTNDAIRANPVLTPSGSALVSTVRGHLFFVKPDGNVERRLQIPGGIAFTPLVLADGSLVVPGNDKKLYLLNPDGSNKITIDLNTQIAAAPVLLTNGKIAVSTSNGVIHVYNSLGTLEYTYNANSRVRNSVTALPDGGFAVGADNGVVHVVRDGGAMLSQYDAGREIRGPGALLRNGQILFASKDGWIHFLNPKETEMARVNYPANCSEAGAVRVEKSTPPGRRDSIRPGA